jgi:hypothetical protein
MAEPTPLQLTNRMYRYVKASAVKGVLDAATELITNADDSYMRLGVDDYDLHISFDYGKRVLQVIDNAEGMSHADLVRKLGTVGNYTADGNVRGFFSRGAKDITSIGNAVFTSVKDGKIAAVKLTTADTIITVLPSRDVTAEDRVAFAIANGNGTHVALTVLPTVRLPEFDRMGNIRKLFTLREIFANKQKRIHTTITLSDGRVAFSDVLDYDPPSREEKPLIDNVIRVPGWPEEATATFTLWKLKERAEHTEVSSCREYGVLVRSNHTNYELTMFYSDLEGSDKAREVYGVLSCPYIDTLMREFEAGSSDNRNTFPAVSANRRGLDRAHPFVKDLYRICHKQLKYVLETLHHQALQEDDLLMDISNILDDLELGGQAVDSILKSAYPFRKTDLTTVTKYLERHESDVIESNPDSVFKFDDMTNIEKAEDGDIEHMASKVCIHVQKDSDFQVASKSFFLSGVFHIHVNADDAILRHSVVAADTGESWTITTPVVFARRTAVLASHELSKQIVRVQQEHMSEDERADISFVDHVRAVETLEHKLLPGMLAALSDQGVLSALVANDE